MKQLYHILLFCCLTVPGFAQIDTIKAAQRDSTSKGKTSAFTLGATYGNTENYYGQSPEEKLPYVLSYAGYRSKSGFSFSVTLEKLLSSGTGIAATDVAMGYGFKPAKNLSASFAYAHYFYQKNSPLLGTTNQNSLSGSLTYNWGVTSGINANYSFGTENDMFISLRNSKMIDLGSLFSDKDYISLEPAVDVITGTVHFYETYTVDRARLRQLLNLPPRPITTTVQSASFGILAYTFSLPLAYNRARYTIEACYQGSVSGQKFSSGSGTSASVFNMSFYYTF